nr:transcription antitermination factor NusB [Paracoccus suum]
MLDSAAAARAEGAERARARRLATAALRLRGRAEAVLTPLLPRRPRPAVADLLVLATVEMLGFDAPPHGVVSEAVALARKQGQKGAAAAGMVNAVLRRAAEGRTAWDAAAPRRMPAWLRGPIVTAWGSGAADAIEAAHERAAPLDLTARKPGTAIEGTEVLPTGSFRLQSGAQISALSGFSTGAWWVQDAAAALPALLLEPKAGERIADLCAAPGGKTLQLAAAGAEVTAVDISAPRLRRLAENLDRCRLTAQMVTADALQWQPDGTLDAILLDAPCTATGTIRRHPELPSIRDGSGLAPLVELQARLLDHAIALLPPGGRLVYSTCSLLTDEGEDQITAALARHPGLTVEQPDPARLGIEPGWITPEGGIRLRPDYWPELGGMDGFYMARLQIPQRPA